KAPVKTLLAELDGIEQRMTHVEHKLIQVDMKASEDSLRFPMMLNEQLESFRQSVETGDGAPTKQQLEVFAWFEQRLSTELGLWQGIVEKEIPLANDELRKLGLPAIDPRATPPGSPEAASHSPGR